MSNIQWTLYADRFVAWRKKHFGAMPLLYILAFVIGLLSGVGAFLLKHMIGWVSGLLTSGLKPYGINPLLIVIPIAGIMLTGLLVRKVFKRPLANGVRRLKQMLHVGDYNLSAADMYMPMLASTVTLGFGGSAGSEGPIACTGAAIGGNLAKMFRLPPHTMMILIGCGAGAGIAGIFKAPLGGAFFTLEVLRMSLTTVSVMALIVATVTAGVTAFALGGFTPDISFDPVIVFDPHHIPAVLLLGIWCGFYSLYYSYIMKKVELWLGKLRRPWIRNLIAGSALGVALFLCPALYGEGYGVIDHVINGHYEAVVADGPLAGALPGTWLMVVALALIIALKCFATSSTNNGGGVAGDFAPTLFAGAMAGMLFATVSNLLFDTMLPIPQCALIGMAGVMAGAIRAPLMATVLVSEMASAFHFFFPLLVVSAISFGIVRFFTFDDYYKPGLDRLNGLLRG